MAIVLHVVDGSPYCRKIRWALAAKGLAVDEVVEGREKARDKCGEPIVPLLDDGGTLVAGSTAILHHLERTRPAPSFFPSDPRRRNQAVTFDEFGDRVLGPLALGLLGRLDWTESGEAPDELAPDVAISELREALDRAREAMARGALGGPEIHLGDLSIASHLEICADVEGLDFEGAYPDLDAYRRRVSDGITSP